MPKLVFRVHALRRMFQRNIGVAEVWTVTTCVVCRHGEVRPGSATVVLRRDGATVVINQVPARVCENCGEEYVDEAIATRLLEAAETAARAGVRVEIRDYVAA